MKEERIIYLISGPHKTKGFNKKITENLKRDLEGSKILTFIASTPDNYEKNDLFVNGNDDDIPGIKSFIKKISLIEKFNILDNRTTKEQGINILKNSDIIYLLGGYPITQIEHLKQNNYDEIIKNFNGIILGTSAGAMNLSTLAYYSKDEDYDKSFFYTGIGLTDITIDPHFDIEDKERVQEAIINSQNKKIVGVPNESAIKIDHNNQIYYLNDCYEISNGSIKKINNVEKTNCRNITRIKNN